MIALSQTLGVRTLRIVTLNIGSLLDAGWDDRFPLLGSQLAELAPDVVCLQEVAESGIRANAAHQVLDVQREHGGKLEHLGYGSLPVTPPQGFFDDEPDLEMGSAVLSRWPVDVIATHPLPLDPDNAGVHMFTYELVHARTAGLDLFSTHLAAAPADGRHRRLQVQEIDRIIREARGSADLDPWDQARPAMPAILCGDFNAEPDSDEIRFLCGLTPLGGSDTFYQDAWRVAGDETPGYTNHWSNRLGGHLNIHRKRIDYVFVGDPFVRRGHGGRVLNAQIVVDEVSGEWPPSDHSGVLAEIVWPDESSTSRGP
ncbi:MAG: hypothetical protein GY701_33740 [Sulfitobacter sp.]|nr:hypothetical protein [Sulfitobacter sp.]